jgi:hypothetical protein
MDDQVPAAEAWQRLGRLVALLGVA